MYAQSKLLHLQSRLFSYFCFHIHYYLVIRQTKFAVWQILNYNFLLLYPVWHALSTDLHSYGEVFFCWITIFIRSNQALTFPFSNFSLSNSQLIFIAAHSTYFYTAFQMRYFKIRPEIVSPTYLRRN